MKQTQKDQLAREITNLAKALVLADNHFLSAAVGRLQTVRAVLEAPFATDGYELAYDADKIIARFKRENSAPKHDLMHCVAHCLFLHPYVGISVDHALWNLACDMAAERAVMDLCGKREGERGAHIASAISSIERDMKCRITAEKAYYRLREGKWADKVPAWQALFLSDDHCNWYPTQDSKQKSEVQGGGDREEGGMGRVHGDADSARSTESATANAEGQNGQTNSQPDQNDTGGNGKAGAQPRRERKEADEQRQSSAAMSDPPSDTNEDPAANQPDSSPSPGHGNGSGNRTQAVNSSPDAATALRQLSRPTQEQLQHEWRQVATALAVNLQTMSAKRGQTLTSFVDSLEDAARERIDYSHFLHQFAVSGEVMKLSDDEFDANFYTYGIRLYGNLPLIEPLEQRLEKRIREFVLVIDTSGSVYHNEVKRFVNTTFALLKETESFFEQVNIRILQCDASVQSDDTITNLDELTQWGNSMNVLGGGGTDFRPAFEYVDALVEAGEFENLGGLIYFTDGKGTYPEYMPNYKVAFVYCSEDRPAEDIPPWAVQIVLDSDTIRNGGSFAF